MCIYLSTSLFRGAAAGTSWRWQDFLRHSKALFFRHDLGNSFFYINPITRLLEVCEDIEEKCESHRFSNCNPMAFLVLRRFLKEIKRASKMHVSNSLTPVKTLCFFINEIRYTISQALKSDDKFGLKWQERRYMIHIWNYPSQRLSKRNWIGTS